MDRRTLSHIALFVVNLIYGVNYVVAKGLMPNVIGASGFILLRVLGAVLLFWTARAFFPEKVRREDVVRLVLCAVFGVALNQLMFFHGLMRTSPVHASIIMVATPILVMVLSGVFLGERITWPKLFGIALGAGGALTLVFFRQQADGVATLRGDLYILINASSFAIYLVLVKPLMMRYSAVTVMAWSFLIGAVIVVPFGVGDLMNVQWSVLTPHQISAMGFVVVVVTFFAYLLNTWALRYVEASVVGTYIYLQPILATSMSIIYAHYGETLTGRAVNYTSGSGVMPWLCAAAIFTGVHLVNRADRMERRG